MTTRLTFAILFIAGLLYTANGQIMTSAQQGIGNRVQNNVLVSYQ